MKKLLLFATLILGSFGVFAQQPTSPPLYTAGPFQDSLWTVDTASWIETNSIVLTSAGFTVDGVNGMSVHPCTGEFYIIYKVAGGGGRRLGTVDVNTGVITYIGTTGDNVSAISFMDANTLYASTGDGASTSESLWTVNQTTGALTLESAMGSGTDGEVICANPDDGMVYHWSGLGAQNADEIAEFYNPVNSTITPITMSGHAGSEIFGATYVGNDKFLLNNINSVYISFDANTGVLDTVGLGVASDNIRGLGFPLNAVWFANANSDTICPFGDSTVMVASSGGTAYQWYLDGMPISGATNDTLVGTALGAYNCEITRATCTAAFSANTINVYGHAVTANNATPTAASYCAGDSVMISDTTSGTSYEWYIAGQLVDSDSIYFASAQGTVEYRLYSANGCYDLEFITVSEFPAVLVSPTGQDISCNGGASDGSAMANASGGTPGFSYLWSNGDTTATTSSSLSVGTYTVIVTDSNGCTVTDSVTIGEPLALSLSATSTDELLGNDGTIDLTVSGGTAGYTYVWSPSGSGEDPTGLAAGTYMVTVTDANGCTDTLSVTVGSQVGISEFGKDAIMNIYPNPNTGHFFMSFENVDYSELTVEVYNAVGQLVTTQSVNQNPIEIDIRAFGAGMYTVKIKDGTRQAARQIIVK